MFGRSLKTGETVLIKVIKKATANSQLMSKFQSKQSTIQQLPESIKLLHYEPSAIYPSRYFGTW